MSVPGWIATGFFAGRLASVVTRTKKRLGCVLDPVIGIVGACVGGVIFSYLHKEKVNFEFDLWSFFVACVGAVAFLLAAKLVQLLFRPPERARMPPSGYPKKDGVFSHPFRLNPGEGPGFPRPGT